MRLRQATSLFGEVGAETSRSKPLGFGNLPLTSVRCISVRWTRGSARLGGVHQAPSAKKIQRAAGCHRHGVGLENGVQERGDSRARMCHKGVQSRGSMSRRVYSSTGALSKGRSRGSITCAQNSRHCLQNGRFSGQQLREEDESRNGGNTDQAESEYSISRLMSVTIMCAVCVCVCRMYARIPICLYSDM